MGSISRCNPTCVCVCVRTRTCVCVKHREKDWMCMVFLLCSAQADGPLMSNDWAPLHSSCYGYQPGSVYTDTHRNFDLQWSTDGRARAPQKKKLNNINNTSIHLPTHMHIHTHKLTQKPSCLYCMQYMLRNTCIHAPTNVNSTHMRRYCTHFTFT